MSVTYRFGTFELEPGERRLLCGGEPVLLGARAFDVLLALVEHHGQLVTKDALLKRVWSRLVVEESNLAVQVSALRKVVGAEAIENVAGHGYRFAMDVAVESRQSASPGAQRHNLPRALTQFIGREEGLEQCATLLEGTRLLTITGTGGIGKTRLSLAIAERQLDDYPDGVWLVELAPLSEAQLVIHEIASVLGVSGQPDRPMLDVVASFLRDRRLLLVLDNCEHVLTACARAAKQLLQAAAHLTVLASSREPMHLAGETIYALQSLSVPDPQAEVSIETAIDSEAVRLFVDRAVAIRPGFALTAADTGAVSAICTTRRHPACARARRSAHARAFGRGYRAAVERPLPAAQGWRPHGAAAPADAAEPRSTGATVSSTRRNRLLPYRLAGLCGRLDARRGRGRTERAAPAFEAAERPLDAPRTGLVDNRVVAGGQARATDCWKRCASMRRSGSMPRAMPMRRRRGISPAT